MWKNNRSDSRGGGVRGLIYGGFGVALAIIVLGAIGFNWLGKPFTTQTKDHSTPPVLTELRNLSDYHAAQAQFSVTVDQEDDVRWMPSFLAGERVQFAAVGTVDAVVDFGGLTDSAIVVSGDGASVTVTLPRATAMEPVIDHDQSHVMNRDRGLFNRVGGMFSDNPTSEEGLYAVASDKMALAAENTDLLQRAEDNTKLMLYSLLRSLGFASVDVRFA
jgi:hypothetical protein